MDAMPKGSRRQELAMELPTAVGRLSSASTERLKDIDAKTFVGSKKEWQEEAYDNVASISQLGYVVNHTADTVARGTLGFIERNPESGKVVEIEKDDTNREKFTPSQEKAARVLNALRGPQGGQASILHSGALCHIIAGEGRFIGEPIEDTGQLSWEFLSVVEIEVDNYGNVKRKRSDTKRTLADDDPRAKIHPDTYVSRYHNPDPKHSEDATSALRRVAPECREIILLTHLVEATIKSSIPAGMFFVPNEMTFPSPDDEGVNDSDDLDNLQEMLIEHWSKAIEDRRSAASIVPLLVSGPADLKDSLGPITVSNTKDNLGWIVELRNDALGRLATGVDAPPEVMTGKAGLNHWTGANVDQDFIVKHVMPVGQRLARFLTIAYLRRMLVEYEDMSEEDAENFELVYDASELVTRADASSVAEQLYDDLIFSDDARIEASGFDPDVVRPSDEERARRIVFQLMLKTGAPQLLPALGIDLAAMGVAPDVADSINRGLAGRPGELIPDLDVEDADRDVGGTVPPTGNEAPVQDEGFARITERVRTEAEAQLVRVLEKSANQILGRLPKSSLLTRDQIRSMKKIDLIRAIPPGDWGAMNLTPQKLLRNAWTDFTGKALPWLQSYHEARGMQALDANELAHRQVSDIVQYLDARALAAFSRPLDSNRDGLRVPLEVILEPLTA